MREASAEREKALLPAARVLLSTHALCQKKKKHTIRDSLFHALWIRDGEMEPHLSELEVERTGKGSREGKEKCGRTRCDTWKGETNNSWSRLPAAKGFLRGLGRNEMRNSYLYSRCKGLAQIAYYSRQSLPRSLNKRRRKNPDTAKTQTQVLKLNKKKPSSPTLKVKGWNKSTHKLKV